MGTDLGDLFRRVDAPRHRHDPGGLRAHRTSTLSRRTVARRGQGAHRPPREATFLDPFNEDAMAEELGWMRNGIDAGHDPAMLQAEIATRLWPWARRFAWRTARRLPPHIDEADVQGRVATALWACCARLDPEPPLTWAVWLTTRLRGAVLDAARASDPLSRRDRSRVKAGTAGPGIEGAGEPPVAIDAVVEISDHRAEPSRTVVDHAVAHAVHQWISHDLPPDLAARLTSWWRTTDATTPLPAALANELRPYRFRLLPAVELLD